MRRILTGLIVVLASVAALKAETVPANPRITDVTAKLPLSFEANQGQADPTVQFLSRGSGYSLFLTRTEAGLVLRDAAAKKPATLRLKFVGASPASVSGIGELSGKSN